MPKKRNKRVSPHNESLEAYCMYCGATVGQISDRFYIVKKDITIMNNEEEILNSN